MIHLLRSTAVFAVRLLLSVAVVYRFFHAENKSIFAQRYGPCTPPDGTKHTNVRRTGTKYKTIVKDMHYPLIPCGFSALAPLAEMRYTGNTETNVKENSLSQNLTVLPAPSGREPLARPQAFHFSRKLYRYAKGPILEGAVCVADWGSSGKLPLPSCRFASSHLPQGDGFRGGGKVSGIAQRRPLGGAGCERSEQTEGVLPAAPERAF